MYNKPELNFAHENYLVFSPTTTNSKKLTSSDNLKPKEPITKKLSDLKIGSKYNSNNKDNENYFAASNVTRKSSVAKQEYIPKSDKINANNGNNLDDSVHQFAKDLDKSPKKISFIDKYSPKKGKRNSILN